MSSPDADTETPRKGRGNAILTYETISGIERSLALVDAKLDRLDEKLDEVGREHDDHEVRLRVLEASNHALSGKTDFSKWLGPVLISLVMLGMSLLNYIKV